MKDIDVVITWVDGSDPKWQQEKMQYTPPEEREASAPLRYRDWDNLQYIFRGIETFMPWVRKVHLITWGHVPDWLSRECPKLNIVKHSDFIPGEYLPTFNSNAIELNMHRIPDLAEQFIYFNDDMFVIKPTTPEDFFVDGKPKDMACISPQPIYRNSIMNIEINNLKILNDYYTIDNIKQHKDKWIKPLLYGQYAVRTAIFMQFKSIIGIFQPHIPYGFLKSTFTTLWEQEGDLLNQVCRNRFRSTDDVNIWLMRSWQLLSGKFVPRSRKFGLLVPASDMHTLEEIFAGHTPQKMICINDDESVQDFETTKDQINRSLNILLPKKSIYEG